jgi:hypothetical protein
MQIHEVGQVTDLIAVTGMSKLEVAESNGVL